MTPKKIIVIGGGAIGLSVAYHLGKQARMQVTLLERNTLTSGTSWHAAGIVGPLRSSRNLTELARYGIELFAALEVESGLATGYCETGGLWLAQHPQRMLELERINALGRMHALDSKIWSPEQAREFFPLLHTDDLAGALWVKQDGQINPVDLCMAYAKAARQSGVEIREHATVTGFTYAGVAKKQPGTLINGVDLASGEHLAADAVVNCAGLWAREVGAMAGVEVPLRAVQHCYVVSEKITELPSPCPIIRDLDNAVYFKGDAGKLVLGTFEKNARVWDPADTDADHSFILFDADWDHATPMLEAGIHRIPRLGEAGTTQFINGPESFTPDTRQIMGRAPGKKNFYVAAGFNSIGIMSSAGVGKAMAEWVQQGHAPMDLWDVSIERFQPRDNLDTFLQQRIPEAVHNQFQMHWPFKQYTTGRDRQRSCWHQQMRQQGAVFGAPTGWERPLWFAQHATEQQTDYSYGEQHWWPYAKRESQALMQSGAVFELSPFSKFLITGDNAANALQHLCTNSITGPAGRVTYSLMLNENAGIEADCTVTRIDTNSFMVVTGAATRCKDYYWLREHLDSDTDVNDITEDYAVLGIMGPHAGALLQQLSDTPLELPDFAFLQSAMLSLDGVTVRASRVSYVGEYGWELIIPNADATAVLDRVTAMLPALQMSFAGHYCLDSCRLEKGYAHWGHDIGPEDTPFDAGLMFAVNTSGNACFIGSTALHRLQQQSAGRESERQRVLLHVESDDGLPLLLHDEPVYYQDRLIGSTTSGGIGFRTGMALSMAYVDRKLLSGAGLVTIDVAGSRLQARVLSAPPYDPTGLRMRSLPT